ncbi:MAG TPA: cytochrome-c oxidase, cbb3-type subunit III [Piscinibacter sp.]|uniref:cytochrome-c oxidase, cbb3-type subunit III n=2 Tax=Pseudomonadota TaxID=1224 RepID=UPI002C7F868C|nr:cytochrome-c oxidase, cbb3-type subunit III [Piscinibacter sp.]
MSDFINNGWSIYIAAVVILGLAACLGLLIIASRRKVMASDNTTGHVWDEDLRELNNPLPRWWMGLFVITVVFAVLYLALYPGLGSFGGQLGWTSIGQLEAEQAKAQAAMAPLYAKFTSQTPEALAKDAQAMAIGERLYINNCAQCHGSDAKGSKGFPNLTLPVASRLATDSFDAVKATITNGRQGMMPPMAAAVGSSEDVKNVANYVLSLSGSPHNELAAQLGKPKFGACAACHGPDGKGNKALGAPNLTDKVWLHGWGEEAIVAMVNNGKTNVMPPQASRMTADQIHVLAAYVWNLAQAAGAQ